MTKVLVDTDVLIDYSKGFFKGLNDLKELQEKGKIILFLNPIVVAEYLADKNLNDVKKLKESLNFISSFKTILISNKMGVVAGEIMRNTSGPNWKDAMIAACCLVESCRLATRNQKHFNKITGLKFV
ncbi:PIN domain-containing protein [Candidatus Collierbacteria bacterium]|nr:PIN domain-containing protein [Candidatus Collierbacteria bacterium]